MKPPHRNECAGRGSRLQLTAVKELQKLRDVGSLNVENIDPAQMLAIHREIVLVRLNCVFGDSFLNAKVLKESLSPLFVSHERCLKVHVAAGFTPVFKSSNTGVKPAATCSA